MDNLTTIPISLLVRALTQKSPSPDEVFKSQYFALFNSGRQALLSLFQKKRWKKIALPTFTCPIIYEAIVQSGAKPVFVDVDLKSFNINPTILKRIPKVDAVIAVNTFGAPIDIAAIKKNLPKETEIVEDRAHMFLLDSSSGADHVLLSLYKEFQNLGGAAILSKEKVFNSETKIKGPSIDDLKKALVLSNLARPVLNLYRMYKPPPQVKYSGKISTRRVVSQIFWQLFSSQVRNVQVNQRARKKTYEQILQKIDKNLFISQTSVKFPFVLSSVLRFGTASDRNELLSRLRPQGIFLDRIWYNSIAPKGSNGKLIADHIVNIPLDPSLSPEKIESIVAKINLTAKQLKNESKSSRR